MKIQLSDKGLRLRLSRDDFGRLSRKETLEFACSGWTFSLICGNAPVSLFANWPQAPQLTLSPRDFEDLCLEPENGIVLPTVPCCEIDVDARDRGAG